MPDIQQHAQIIKGREVAADDWSVLRLAEGETPETVDILPGKIIVPLKVWQARREALLARAGAGQVGLWFAPDELANTAGVKSDAMRSRVARVAATRPS